MPPRPLSRNSTRVAWVPTATMSLAPFSSASSIAMSSLVAEAGKVIASTPRSWTRARPGARPSAEACTTTPAPQRGESAPPRALTPASGRVVAHRVHVADDHVGLVAGLPQRVGAAVDTDQHRPVVADVGAEG